MDRRASAYDALGLEPGADRDAVEQAYRRLIKLHHPDRSGGDAARAAEINRAYFDLRPGASPPEGVQAVHPPPRRRVGRSRPRRRQGSPALPLLVVILGIAALTQASRIAEMAPRWGEQLREAWRPILGKGSNRQHADAAVAMDGPLTDGMIEVAIRDAFRGSGNEARLAASSRDCHRRMRADPSIEQFDRCAAFDNAVAAIEDRDPLRDSGAFNASAVTARLLTAASLLSNDYLAIERRLDRIRSTVELRLMPAPLPRLEPAPDPELPAQAIPDGPD